MKSRASSHSAGKAHVETDGGFVPERIFADIKARLSLGDGRETGSAPNFSPPSTDRVSLHAAAVLVGLVSYPDEVTVILTRRSTALPVHSGQIAFPGGKIEPFDESPAAAALREANEEIGLDARHVEPIGYLQPRTTGTGFRVVPVVAKIEPPLRLRLNQHEVEEAFEVPFAFLMNEANHSLCAREWQGQMRQFYAMVYEKRDIWGLTASILRNLYERLYL